MALLVFYLRPARERARATAVAEALALLRELGATALAGGPLSERGGLFWISLPAPAVARARGRLPRLGYSYAVDLLESARKAAPGGSLVRWRGRGYRLRRLYEEDADAVPAEAPDRRVFTLEAASGVRQVPGYRGGGGPLQRRGLPVVDARMLVNLSWPGEPGTFLDPFASGGGIVIEALAHGHRVLSSDDDGALRYGLASLGAEHVIADARHLPLASRSIDAIATEPPYAPEAEGVVWESLSEMARVVRAGGRLVMLCPLWQAGRLRSQADSLRLTLQHEERVDRKGVDCAVLLWEKMRL